MEITITEQDLLDFGFERINETPESSGSDSDWHYYTLDIEDFCLISNASDETTEDGDWSVYIFDYNGFEFTEIGQLASLINALKSGIKNKK